ncbi:hypothetical protein PROFUN_08019 [Planoprotostelium fungivorum]|uniref:DAGKc domain-containing protein n=1 Tax=Planoprotostelium fungivorum TaxID=1890364 RepID=A0A2P6MVE0_9EUKA|nr:hypothetical protein PROFUN_08019 [Planoprotostelium fungivorum]
MDTHWVTILLILIALPFLTFVIGALVQNQWRRSIKSKVESYRPSATNYWKELNRPVLCVINPFGGAKLGRFIYEEKSGIQHEAVYTLHAQHPKQLAEEINIYQYGAQIIIHSWINGLANRKTKGSPEEILKEVLHKVPVSFVPGGSSNGVCASFGIDEIYEAIKNFIEGTPKPLDVMEVKTYEWEEGELGGPRERVFDIHALSYGITTDFDVLTEGPLRFLGPTIKNFLAPILVVLSGKRYDGSVLLRPVDVPHEDIASGELKDGDPKLKRKGICTDPNKFEKVKAPACAERKEGDWYKIPKSKIALFVTMNVGWGASGYCAAPGFKPDDGAVDMVIARNVGTVEMFRFLVGMETGTHARLPHVEIVQVDEVVLETSKTELITVSGEPLERGVNRFVVKVHKGLGMAVYHRYADFRKNYPLCK